MFWSRRQEEQASRLNLNNEPYNPHEQGQHKACNWCGRDTGQYGGKYSIREHLSYFEFESLSCMAAFAGWMVMKRGK